MDRLQLIAVKNPFDKRDRDISVIEYRGESLLALRDCLYPSGVEVVASLNGKIVPIEELGSTYPLAGDQIVFVPAVHDNGSDILRVVAMIAVVAVAVWAAPAVAGFFGITSAAGIYGVTAALAMTGGILVNAILPPTSNIATADSSVSQTYSWSPSTTQQQGLVVPRIYGLNKVYGNIVASSIETDGSDQYLNILLCLGLGPVSRLYDYKISEQPYENYSGVEVHTRLGRLNQAVMENFSETKAEYSASERIVYGTPYTYVTIGDSFDALEVDVTFSNGLYYTNNSGNLDNYSVDVRVEIRKQGNTSWQSITTQTISTQQTAYNGKWSLGYWSYDGEGGAFWYEYQAGDSNSYSHYDGEAQDVIFGDYYARYYWRWVTDAYIQTVSSTVDYATITAAQSSSLTQTFRVDNLNLDRGTYEIRVTNLTADQTSVRYSDDMYLLAVREIFYDDFSYPRHVLVGIKALASDQISGSLNFSCMVEGAYVRVYDGASWSAAYSNNPAWVAYDIVTQPLFDDSLNVLEYRGLNPNVLNIDHSKFKEWADWCDELVPDGNGGQEKRITLNGVFDSETTLWEAFLQVCQVGRAIPVWIGGKLTLVIDKATTPTQLFTVGNTGVDSFEETFLSMEERAAEIEIDFINSENNYQRDRFSIFNTALDNKSTKVTLQLPGITKPSEAWRAGQYRLYCNQYITRTIKLEVSVDSLASTVGDVIYVQHDVPQWGYGGRVVSATSTTVTLDREVPIVNGTAYTIMIRLSDDTLVEKSIVTGSSGNLSTLSVSTPFTTVPSKYDVYAFGETNKVTKPFRIVGLRRSSDLTCTLTCVEYNESIYNSDSGTPVIPTPNYSSLEVFPSVKDLSLDELLVKSQDGTITDCIDVYFTKPASSMYSSAEVWYNSGGGWTYAGQTSDVYFRISGVTENKTYKVAVSTVNVAGQKQPVAKAPSSSIYTLGKLAPPSDVTGFSVTAENDQVKLSWTHIPDADLSGYEVRLGSAWDSGTVLATNVSQNVYYWKPTQAGSLAFWIKAIDTSGIYSLSTSSATLTIVAPTISDVTQQVVDNNVLLKWTGIEGTFPIDYYEIRKGDVFSTASIVGEIYGTFSTIFETQSGTYKYWVAPVDTAGLYGTEASVTATVNQPPDFILNQDRDDDFTSGISEECYYAVDLKTGGDGAKSRGWNVLNSSYADVMDINTTNARQMTIDHGTTGTNCWNETFTAPFAYRYLSGDFDVETHVTHNASQNYEFALLVARDPNASSGEDSVNISLGWSGSGIVLICVSVVNNVTTETDISSTDAYLRLTRSGNVFTLYSKATASGTWAQRAQYTRNDFKEMVQVGIAAYATGTAGTFVAKFDYFRMNNGIVEDLGLGGKFYAGVDSIETFEQHFTKNNKTSMQDYINAGYIYFPQPCPTTAKYVEILDFEATIGNSSVVLSLDKLNVIGGFTITPKVSVSTDRVSWTDYSGNWQIYATDFRYTKTELAFSGSGENLTQLNIIDTELSLKEIRDEGMGTVVTASSGAVVTFNKTFVDIASITVTPQGTTAKMAIYDFVDVANPTQFTVYLFDKNGNYVTGSFSWSAVGY